MISGLGDFVKKIEKDDDNRIREIYKISEEGRSFLVVNRNTIEVRTDKKLGELLCAKYESVMKSRYFGKGGIEIVDSGQMSKDEIEDLVRLSYNLTK